jgi:hypothetical protein
MESRKITLASGLTFSSTRSSSLDLPMNGIINKIRARVTGTYTGTDGNLSAEAPYNIFSNIAVKTSKGQTAYSLASKDLRIANYLDKKGQVVSSIGSGAYEMNFILDRGELLAYSQDKLPSNVDHPALPFGGLTLAVTWATDLQFGATDIVITAGSASIELEETLATISELQAIYGERLERYQFPQLITQGDVGITSNSAPLKVLKPVTGGLKKRIIIVASNSSSVRNNTVVTKIQLKNSALGEQETPIDRTFLSMQNEDKEQYDLGTALVGVASIDILSEITNDNIGMRSYRFDEKLELHTQNSATGFVRIIEENKIVNVSAFEQAIASGLVR